MFKIKKEFLVGLHNSDLDEIAKYGHHIPGVMLVEVAGYTIAANAEITRQAQRIKELSKINDEHTRMLEIYRNDAKKTGVKLAQQAQRIAELEFSLDDYLGINDDIASQLIVKDERIAELEALVPVKRFRFRYFYSVEETCEGTGITAWEAVDKFEADHPGMTLLQTSEVLD